MYYQVPRYGFHKGEWNGETYYWTGYDPGYPSFPNRRQLPPSQDVTNNIQALVAKGLASVGYHKRDARMLELARGLLWYLCRSFEIDGRWYYHGPENPLASTKAISHETVCVSDSMIALLYLYKAGVDVRQLVAKLEPAIKFYTLHQVPTKPTPTPVQPTQLITAYKLLSKNELKVGDTITFSTLFQIRLEDAENVLFYDRIPKGVSYNSENLTIHLCVWRNGDWVEIWNKKIDIKSLIEGIKVLERPSVYEIYKVEYGPFKVEDVDLNLESSIIRVGDIVKKATTQQPSYNLKVNSTSFLNVISLIMFPKEPSDPKVKAYRRPTNLIPIPLLTESEASRYVSQEAKDAISKALTKFSEAEKAFQERRLEESKRLMEEALNLINDARILDYNFSRRYVWILLGIGLTIVGMLALTLLFKYVKSRTGVK